MKNYLSNKKLTLGYKKIIKPAILINFYLRYINIDNIPQWKELYFIVYIFKYLFFC